MQTNNMPKNAPEDCTKNCAKTYKDETKMRPRMMTYYKKKKCKKDAKYKKPCQKRHQKIAPKIVQKTCKHEPIMRPRMMAHYEEERKLKKDAKCKK